MKKILFVIAALLFATSAIQAQEVADWNQWRGPNRDGLVSNAAWPNSLSEANLAKLWSVDLGPSYSGPIVANGMVFTTETKDKKFEVVHAFDQMTGKKIWSTEWKGSLKVPFFASRNGDWIRSTTNLRRGQALRWRDPRRAGMFRR